MPDETYIVPDATSSDDSISEGDTGGGREALLRLVLEAISSHHSSESADEDNISSDDEDADDDEENEYEDEDDDDEDDEEEDDTIPSNSGKIPVGKRVILRSDFRSNRAYCNAVVKSIQRLLRKQGEHVEPRTLRDGVKAFLFDKTTNGVDIDCHILVEYDINNIRIEMKFNVDNLPGRLPLLTWFSGDRNYSLRYGKVVCDYSDGEKLIRYSTSFKGSFSEEQFTHYYEALEYTLKAYGREYSSIAGDKRLSSDQRKIVRKMISELSVSLNSKVTDENADMYNKAVKVLGGNLSSKDRKLLNYLVERARASR